MMLESLMIRTCRFYHRSLVGISPAKWFQGLGRGTEIGDLLAMFVASRPSGMDILVYRLPLGKYERQLPYQSLIFLH